MRVTVDVKGEETHEVDLAELAGGSTASAVDRADRAGTAVDGEPATTYADLLAAIDYSPHEVSVLVDGRPVPEDRPVEAAEITVLRLIKGG